MAAPNVKDWAKRSAAMDAATGRKPIPQTEVELPPRPGNLEDASAYFDQVLGEWTVKRFLNGQTSKVPIGPKPEDKIEAEKMAAAIQAKRQARLDAWKKACEAARAKARGLAG